MICKTSLEDLAPNVIDTTYTKEILLSLGSAGRASGIYPEPIDPPRLLRRARPYTVAFRVAQSRLKAEKA